MKVIYMKGEQGEEKGPPPAYADPIYRISQTRCFNS